jgi:pimeloyl-ACP methyl ester carboxylesterase
LEINSAADFMRMTRSTLAATGFVRKTMGDGVYWESDANGAGQSPIVLVHGINDHAGTWFAIAPALAAKHRVIIPDLAGHGESEPFTGPLPFSLVFDRLEALIENERDIILVGNSFGGWLAVLYALAHPDRVKRLVLEAAGGLARPYASPLFAHDREQALLILRNVHGPNFQAPQWVIDALIERSKDSQMLRITEAEKYILDDRLAGLHVPTTLIWGADDGVIPIEYAEEWRDLIEGAELHVLEGAAHIPHMQQPGKVLQCLTAIC